MKNLKSNLFKNLSKENQKFIRGGLGQWVWYGNHSNWEYKTGAEERKDTSAGLHDGSQSNDQINPNNVIIDELDLIPVVTVVDTVS